MIQFKKRLNIFIPFVFVLIFSSCDQVKTDKEKTGSDTAAADKAAPKEIEPENPKPSEKKESVRSVPDGFDPKIGPFISSLKKDKMQQVLEPRNEFVILSPGPGLYPVINFGNKLEDVADVPELKGFFVDPDFINLPIYKATAGKCEIRENFSDGIYISEKSFESIFIADPMDDEDKTKQINDFIEANKGRKGYEFIIKYTNEQIIVNILAYEKDGKLFIALMDFTDCSA